MRLLFIFSTLASLGFKCCSRFGLLWLAQNRDRRHERRNRGDSSGPNDRKELGRLGGANYVFGSLQLPIQILERATEIILLLIN